MSIGVILREKHGIKAGNRQLDGVSVRPIPLNRPIRASDGERVEYMTVGEFLVGAVTPGHWLCDKVRAIMDEDGNVIAVGA